MNVQGEHELGPGDGIEPLLEEVGEVANLRTRDPAALTPADRVTSWLLGGGFAAFAVACAALVHMPDWRTATIAAGLVVIYGLAHRTEFVAATGSTVPTEPVLVALLFSAPIGLVPVLVLIGLVLGGGFNNGPGGPVHRLLVRVGAGWHCAGPVIVLWASGVSSPVLQRWPVLLAALGAQFLGDAIGAVVRCAALGVSPRRLSEPMSFTFAVDALLAPLAVCAVLAADHGFAILVFAALPVALLRVLAVDRNQHLSTAVTLGKALKTVRDEARMDPMTGLANRRAWEEAVADTEQSVDNCGQGQLTTVVLMADIDHLKAVNDTYGHGAGDDLLRAFAATLSSTAPEGAVVSRLGGDEFGMLFRVDSDNSRAVQELMPRLRAAMARCIIPCGETVSASLGLASCPPAASVADAIRLADQAASKDKDTRQVSRGPDEGADVERRAVHRRAGRAPGHEPRAVAAATAHH
jgi:diguanylate cyclase (GGDEF)-like protein